MAGMSITEISKIGFYIGVGVGLGPFTATLLIASSRVIFINIIANVILTVLPVDTVEIGFYDISLIEVPSLWKISKISAMIGAGIVTLSLIAALVNAAYLRYTDSRSK